MSTDLLELLKEARAGLLDHRGQCQVCANLIHSIDSALAARDKQAEPVVVYGGRRLTGNTNEIFGYLWNPLIEPERGEKLYAAPPDVVPRDLHDRLIREAKRDVVRKAAAMIGGELLCPDEVIDWLRRWGDEVSK